MDDAEKMELLTNICNIKTDLYGLRAYADALNTQKMGKPMHPGCGALDLMSTMPTRPERDELQRLRERMPPEPGAVNTSQRFRRYGGGGKRKASSKKRKPKKRKSKKRKSKTRRRR